MEKLTAPQFARLTELLVKGSNLTAEETAEKASLEALIVAEDNDPPAEDEQEDSGETTLPADDAGGEGEGEAAAALVEDDIDPAAFEKLGMKAKFSLLFSSRAGLLAKLTDSRAALATAQAAVSNLTARATAAEASLATAQTSLTEATARVTTLEGEARDLNAAVTDELAGLGVPRKDLVAGLPDGETNSPVEAAYEDFRAANTPEEKAAAHQRLKAAEAAAKAKAKTA